MEYTSLSPLKNQDFSGQNNLEILRNNDSVNHQIKQGMSPKEISEAVSDHLIEVVKKQFEVAKKEYREKL